MKQSRYASTWAIGKRMGESSIGLTEAVRFADRLREATEAAQRGLAYLGGRSALIARIFSARWPGSSQISMTAPGTQGEKCRQNRWGKQHLQPFDLWKELNSKSKIPVNIKLCKLDGSVPENDPPWKGDRNGMD